MTPDEKIVADNDFWRQLFNASSFIFPWCPLVTMMFAKTAVVAFSIIGVSFAISIFIAVKYYRSQNAKWAMLERTNREERISALYSKP